MSSPTTAQLVHELIRRGDALASFAYEASGDNPPSMNPLRRDHIREYVRYWDAQRNYVESLIPQVDGKDRT